MDFVITIITSFTSTTITGLYELFRDNGKESQYGSIIAPSDANPTLTI